MSTFELVQGSCTEYSADAVVNAANRYLGEGGGICGRIFGEAGSRELAAECAKHKTPLKDGEAVITSACNMKNFKAIIHAVGPNLSNTPGAFDKLADAYYSSMVVLKENGLHSISFPLISAGIFAGRTDKPAGQSTRYCLTAYKKFVDTFPEYDIDVKLCAYENRELAQAKAVCDEFGM